MHVACGCADLHILLQCGNSVAQMSRQEESCHMWRYVAPWKKNKKLFCRATNCRREELVGGTHPEKKSTCKLSQRRACGRDPPEKKKNKKLFCRATNCRREELVGGTHREKKKKIRACGLCLWLELVACCLRPTPDRHYALSRIGRLMVELLSITESHAFKLQKLWSSRVSQF